MTSRAVLLAPFTLARAQDAPEQLEAAVHVLQAAVTMHPSLAEALLLPTNLTNPGSSTSNKVRGSPVHEWLWPRKTPPRGFLSQTDPW